MACCDQKTVPITPASRMLTTTGANAPNGSGRADKGMNSNTASARPNDAPKSAARTSLAGTLRSWPTNQRAGNMTTSRSRDQTNEGAGGELSRLT